MFGRIRGRKHKVGRKGRAPIAYSLRPMVFAKYDAAQTTDENRRHWASADGLSADAAANPEVRRIIRKRARCVGPSQPRRPCRDPSE